MVSQDWGDLHQRLLINVENITTNKPTQTQTRKNSDRLAQTIAFSLVLCLSLSERHIHTQ